MPNREIDTENGGRQECRRARVLGSAPGGGRRGPQYRRRYRAREIRAIPPAEHSRALASSITEASSEEIAGATFSSRALVHSPNLPTDAETKKARLCGPELAKAIEREEHGDGRQTPFERH